MAEKTKSLMVIDDDPSILRIVNALFVSSEFQVVSAKDGIEAVRRIDACGAGIDVILIHMVMRQGVNSPA